MIQTIYLGAGCFWGVEESFCHLEGVIQTEVGYMGGDTESPSYHEVCKGNTGHAEVVRVQFDLAMISLENILDIFWKTHNPTTLNRQGPDRGTQYRSVIFCKTREQLHLASESREQLTLSGQFDRPIVTEIILADHIQFFPAEDYHQKYLQKNGGGCSFSS